MTGADLETPSVPLRWVLYDVDFETGVIRWERTLHTATPGSKHEKNSYASETPVTDGNRVYVYLGYVGLFAFDLDGTQLWHTAMDAPEMREGWGTASSPVVHGDRLFLVNDSLDQSFVAAYDTATGSELWRVDRDEASNWSTPFIWQNDVRTEVVTTGTGGVRSYDLDGRYLWGLEGMSSIQVATPFTRHGLLYINSGYTADSNRPVYAIRSGAAGDISLPDGTTSNDYVVWSHPTLGSYNPSALVYGDYHYTLLDRGILICHDARTGAEVYPRQRVSRGGTLFTASPWAYNGKIFAISEDGDTYVVKAGPEFELLGTNALNEWTLATPAIANGSLIVRTVSNLYRISEG
jgi:outer membrane protein assembly factor BamB